MFIDSHTIPQDTVIEADICLIGAGAAGITIAREFIGKPYDVCLLESGGFEFAERLQSLYAGDTLSSVYPDPAATRLRQFGGSTNHWSGTSRPFDDLTLEHRPGLPYSGWPIKRADLEPYFKRAHSICGLGPFHYSNAFWGRVALPQSIRRVENIIYQRAFPFRFNEQYRSELERARNVSIYLFANVLELQTAGNGTTVNAVRVGCLDANRFTVTARIFVLAAGGIENARLLLVSDRTHNKGLGNTHDVVGRFLTEHPALIAGEFLPSNPLIAAPRFDFPRNRFHFLVHEHRRQQAERSELRPRLGLSPHVVRTEQLVQVLFEFDPHYRPSSGVESLKRVLDSIGNRQWPDDFSDHLGNIIADLDDIVDVIYKNLLDAPTGPFNNARPLDRMDLVVEMEQSPNPGSRVFLSDKRDQFGVRRVTIDWNINSADKDRLRRAVQLLALEFGAAGLGRIRSLLQDEHGDWPDMFGVGLHQMGTTRMHNNPRQGVVDETCRVHGLHNLFIAGSSVFPTVGHERPTLNLVALALRLTDHIKRILA